MVYIPAASFELKLKVNFFFYLSYTASEGNAVTFRSYSSPYGL